jgi:hypothetical protein
MRYGELGSQPVDVVEISVRLVFVLLFQLGFVKGRVAEGFLLGRGRGVDGRRGRGGLGQTGLLDSLSFASGDRSGLSGGFGVRAFAGVSRGRVGKRDVFVLRWRLSKVVER